MIENFYEIPACLKIFSGLYKMMVTKFFLLDGLNTG